MNGPEFKKARRLVKIYQKQLAKETGVGCRSIEMYEQGKSQIASDKFEIILNAIGYYIKLRRPARKDDRKTVLLKAAYNLLNKQNMAKGVLNMLEQTAHYDETECDGNCLLDDVLIELDVHPDSHYDVIK